MGKKKGGGGDAKRAAALRRLPGGAAAQAQAERRRREASAKIGPDGGGGSGEAVPTAGGRVPPKDAAARGDQGASQAQVVQLSIAAEGAVRQALGELKKQQGNPEAGGPLDEAAERKAVRLVLPELQRLGFSEDKILDALKAVPAGNLGAAQALDWLCMNLSADELPRQLASGTHSYTSSGEVTVIAKSEAATVRRNPSAWDEDGGDGSFPNAGRPEEAPEERRRRLKREQEKARIEREKARVEREKLEEAQRKEERRRQEERLQQERRAAAEEKEQQKAHIMRYMEMESSEEEEEEEYGSGGLNQDNPVEVNAFMMVDGRYLWSVWSDPLNVQRRRASRPSEIKELASVLHQELSIVQQEAAAGKKSGDKAKQATAGRLIRDLMQELRQNGIPVDKKSMSVQKGGDDSLGGRQAAAAAPVHTPHRQAEPSASLAGTAASSVEESEDSAAGEEDGFGMDIFQDMGDEAAPTNPTSSQRKLGEEWLQIGGTSDRRISTSGKSSGKAAGGSDEQRLPKNILLRHCQKKQLPAPRYERMKAKSTTNSNKYQYAVIVHVPDEGKGARKGQGRPTTISLESEDGVWKDIQGSQNAAATKALFRICDGQPLHHILPSPYRELWIGWEKKKGDLSQESKQDEIKKRNAEFNLLLSKVQDARIASLRQIPRNQKHITPEVSIFDRVKNAHKDPSSGPDEDRSDAWDLQELMGDPESVALRDELMRRRQIEDLGDGHPGEHLPITGIKEELLEYLEEEDFIIICAETGSGKTTQVPQFILDHEAERFRGAATYIMCTQPRRIAAVSVAERVAEERGEPRPGARGSRVGYHVRLDAASHKGTKLMFCTTGILLRQMASNPTLEGISHVLIDEVHERTMQSDFLLALVRAVAKRRNSSRVRPLKVVLMSATMDATLFSRYLGGCRILAAPGRAFEVKQHYLEDVYEMIRYQLAPDSRCSLRYYGGEARRNFKAGTKEEEHLIKGGWGDDITGREILSKTYDPELYQGYSTITRRNLIRLDETKIDYDLLEELLMYLVETTQDGAILVFLPGAAEINRLHDVLAAAHRFRNHWILPCHSNVNPEDQRRVFHRPPEGVRKIVLSTNIAETSITIDDCVYVIDTGKVKERQYDAARGMGLLLEGWVPKASARQRKGRAGRVRPGECFSLYTRARADSFHAYAKPEIMRVPLEELCLQIKLLRLGSCKDFLSKVVQPPGEDAVEAALRSLREARAIDEEENLTALGHHLAQLPVDCKVGRMLILSTFLGCLDPILTIAACLSYKSPFSAPMENRDAADRARAAMSAAGSGNISSGQFSDHLTMLAAFNGWRDEQIVSGKRGGKRFSRAHYLSESTLQMISDLRAQLAAMLADVGFIQAGRGSRGKGGNGRGGGHLWRAAQMAEAPEAPWNAHAGCAGMVKAALCAGLYPNIAVMEQIAAQIDHSKNRWFGPDRKDLALHPSSVNHGGGAPMKYPYPFIVYLEKMRTSRIFLRDTSCVSPYALLLFGGALSVDHGNASVDIDGWINLKAPAQTAVLFKELRLAMDAELQKIIEKPGASTLPTSNLMRALARLLAEEAKQVIG